MFIISDLGRFVKTFSEKNEERPNSLFLKKYRQKNRKRTFFQSEKRPFYALLKRKQCGVILYNLPMSGKPQSYIRESGDHHWYILHRDRENTTVRRTTTLHCHGTSCLYLVKYYTH